MTEKSMNEMQNEGKERRCPECGSDKLAFEEEELYCQKCGFVIE